MVKNIRIETKKYKTYPSFEALPKNTQKVCEALVWLDKYRRSAYLDDDGNLAPTNNDISRLSEVSSDISNHLGVLDKNGYIIVTYSYHTYDSDLNKIFRSHAIQVLDKAKKAIEAQKNKNFEEGKQNVI